MIDVQQLRQDPQPYKDSAKRRGLKLDIDKLLKLDEDVRELTVKRDGLRSELKSKGKPTATELEKLQAHKTHLEKVEAELEKLQVPYEELLHQVPNLIAPNTPDGDEEANRQEKAWGSAKKTDAQDHLTFATQHGWIDFERGAKVAGSKFYFLKGALVKLELAVTQLVLSTLEDAGFVPMIVPNMVTTRIAAGTGYLPRGEERQIYKVEGEDLNLIATSEMPLGGYHADEILEAEDLPHAYAGWSPSYRVEGGAYGKYSKGLYRVHQFNKVEMYVFCRSEESGQWHQKLLELEEQICQLLEVPYRVVRIAAGDLGAPAYKKYDVEYWSPVEGQYRELMSCSNVTDYQARRLNIRTRGADGKTIPVHTLNATAAAFSRMPIALLENHQTTDGRVAIPKALQSYYGGEYLV